MASGGNQKHERNRKKCKSYSDRRSEMINKNANLKKEEKRKANKVELTNKQFASLPIAVIEDCNIRKYKNRIVAKGFEVRQKLQKALEA